MSPDQAGAHSHDSLRQRLWLAWHVLRGRPLIYRFRLTDTLQFGSQRANAVIARCTITPATPPLDPSDWRVGMHAAALFALTCPSSLDRLEEGIQSITDTLGKS